MEKKGRLQGRHVVITGANRGIGSAIVRAAAAEGADVYACARKRNPLFEEELAGLSERTGVCIRPIYFDLALEEEVKAGVQQILKGLKEKNHPSPVIDVLVNNAGVSHSGLMTMTPLSKVREVFDVNFFAQVQMMQLVGRHMMRNRRGVIINIASVGGIEAGPGYLAYGSSKASLIWATRMAARELGGYGIRVNAVAPSVTDTDMGYTRSEEDRRSVLERTPLGRMARPEEVAEAVLFLASEEASFITGEILKVDGGRVS